eukprot:CAMPEP_0170320470 /NCGR_PEP_ID=MMETSP0116_2-20130129/60973_1 /TAXON_ID=400756 /ORGANISM="Durinskia baltica, Strain CSIRO CS-38" /LENGTH=35 /DNA_ID= /DNA_START= /DNA_END= /DNA_ORIENTATION=
MLLGGWTMRPTDPKGSRSRAIEVDGSRADAAPGEA